MARGKKEDFSFRDLTNGLVLIVDSKVVAIAGKEFEHKNDDNAVLTWGYIDHTAGITFEILCVARCESGDKVEYRTPNKTVSFKLRYDSFDGEIILLSEKLIPVYQDKISMIQNGYVVSDEILKARNSSVFDDFRHPQFPDDMLLYFIQPGLQTEGIWCRVDGEENGRPTAYLLDEPNQDFGVHLGETLAFDWTKQDKKLIGIARTLWIILQEKQKQNE